MPPIPPLRLGVNVDHVATVRNARAIDKPDPVRAALLAIEAGADGITAHLREDRRHIRDEDMARLKAEISKPLNFEMAVTDEMVAIALKTKPHAVCLVPERRQEITTEGGLDVIGQHNALVPVIAKFKDAGVRVSLFIGAEPSQIEAAVRSGAPVIEIHVGAWCEAVAAGEHERAETRVAAHRCGREAREVRRPRSPRRPRARLRDGGDDCLACRDRRTEHRPLHDRRGDVRRPCADREGYARGHGSRAIDAHDPEKRTPVFAQ